MCDEQQQQQEDAPTLDWIEGGSNYAPVEKRIKDKDYVQVVYLEYDSPISEDEHQITVKWPGEEEDTNLKVHVNEELVYTWCTGFHVDCDKCLHKIKVKEEKHMIKIRMVKTGCCE